MKRFSTTRMMCSYFRSLKGDKNTGLVSILVQFAGELKSEGKIHGDKVDLGICGEDPVRRIIVLTDSARKTIQRERSGSSEQDNPSQYG